jgi:DNA-binding CsgD family transcriptional regulator
MLSHMRSIADADVEALLRIAAEASGLMHDLQARRAFILDRLLALIGGCGAACCEIDPSPANASGWCLPDTITLAGGIAAHASVTRRYLTGHLGALDPCIPYLLRNPDPVVTFRRADVIDGSWYDSEHFNDLRRPRGLGESIYAALTLPGGGRLKLTLFRQLHDSPFTEREVGLVHIFNSNLAGLYAAKPISSARPIVDARAAGLPPRLRPVLQRLLAGDSEKQAARHLALSRHTIHRYANALYRAFRVNSRSELLAQFVTRDATTDP